MLAGDNSILKNAQQAKMEAENAEIEEKVKIAVMGSIDSSGNFDEEKAKEELDEKVYPLEIKKSFNPGKQAIKNFDVIQKFGMEIGNGGAICLTKDIFPIDKNNNLIPIELL